MITNWDWVWNRILSIRPSRQGLLGPNSSKGFYRRHREKSKDLIYGRREPHANKVKFLHALHTARPAHQTQLFYTYTYKYIHIYNRLVQLRLEVAKLLDSIRYKWIKFQDIKRNQSNTELWLCNIWPSSSSLVQGRTSSIVLLNMAYLALRKTKTDFKQQFQFGFE